MVSCLILTTPSSHFMAPILVHLLSFYNVGLDMVISNKMANGDAPLPMWQIIMQYLTNLGPMLITLFTVWQIVDRVAKYLSIKQEAKLKLLIKETVQPDTDKLQSSIDRLEETIGQLTESVNKLKYGK